MRFGLYVHVSKHVYEILKFSLVVDTHSRPTAGRLTEILTKIELFCTWDSTKNNTTV